MIDNVAITAQIGGYLLDFQEAGIVVKVGRLDTHKDGRVTGELTISNGALVQTAARPQRSLASG